MNRTLLLLAALAAGPARADTCSWTGTPEQGPGVWSDAEEWTCGHVPGPTDDVVIDYGGVFANDGVVLDVDPTVNSLTITYHLDSNGNFAGSGDLQLGGHTLTTPSFTLSGGIVQGVGTLLVQSNLAITTTVYGGAELGGGATLRLLGTGTLSGVGNFRFPGATFEVGPAGTFSILSDIGTSTCCQLAYIVNEGVFQKAGGSGVSVIEPAGFTNSGTIRAASGTLQLNGNDGWQGNLYEDGSVLGALAGARLSLFGKNTFEGTTSGNPAGTIELGRADTGDGALVYTPAGGGTVDFGGTGLRWARGSVLGSTTRLTNADLLVLDGGWEKRVEGGATLINEGTLRVVGAGNFNIPGGRIENEAGAQLRFESDADMDACCQLAYIENAGLFAKTGGSDVSQIYTNGFTNLPGGVVSAESGWFRIGAFGQHQAGALIQGTATVEPHLGALNGDVAPGLSPGVLTWVGNYAPSASSTLRIEIAGTTVGTGYDQLAVTGDAALNGVLRLTHGVAFFPQVGQSFTVLTASSVSGTFSSVQVPNGYSYAVTYNAASVVATVTARPSLDLNATNLTPLTVEAGGSVQFRYAIRNNTGAAVSGQLWYTATGGSQGMIQSATVPANTTAGPATFTQPIPANAPPGTYTYVLRVGQYPGTTVDQVAFTVVVTPPSRWAGEAIATAEVGAEGAPAAASVTGGLPAAYALAAAYPNPFRGRATLRYEVPEPSAVRLAVYDLLGREVAVLVDREERAGRHEAVLDGARLTAGLYVVRMTAGPATFTQRVTLVR